MYFKISNNIGSTASKDDDDDDNYDYDYYYKFNYNNKMPKKKHLPR